MCPKHFEAVHAMVSARQPVEPMEEGPEEPLAAVRGTCDSPLPRKRPRYDYLSPIQGGWTEAGLSPPTCPAVGTQGTTHSDGSNYQLSQEGDPMAAAIRQIASLIDIPNDQVHFTDKFATKASSTKAKRANIATKVINAVIWLFFA